MVVIYSIEGNIGSGKSTLVDMLKQYLKKSSTADIIFVPEPVDVWETIKDDNGETIISKFYADLNKYAFSFQMMAYISRISLLRKIIKKHPDAILITERSVFTDKNVFAKMLYDDDKIEDVNYQIYLKWFDEFTNELPICNNIYVRTTPEICYERVIKRNRNGETISLDYLKNCNSYHDDWLLNNKNCILQLDGNVDMKPTYQCYSKWIHIISECITYNNIQLSPRELFDQHKELCSYGC